ncbi:MAG TPA: 50S ribosomal protein L27 [Phycisphaerales bacterium]|nr:50S ribosomal protein L27 [Phycisphaerales bacterium]
MAHKKGQGSTKNGRDSNPQYRGIKLYGGEIAQPGSIIVRQVGTPFQPGYLVRMGRDNTLFAVGHGRVIYQGRRVHLDPLTEGVPRPVWLNAPAGAASA